MQYSDNFLSLRDNLKIYYRLYNPASHKIPLICLPGLTRNSKDFDGFAQRRAMLFNDKIIAIDMCGRGRSDYSSDIFRYDLIHEVADILQILEREKITKAHFLGMSRGGMQSALIAGMMPSVVHSVILGDIGRYVPMKPLEHIGMLFNPNSPVHYNLDDALKMRRIYDNNMTRDLSVTQEIEIIHATFKVIDGVYIPNFDKAGLGEAYFNNLKGLKLLNPDMLDLSSLIMNLAKIPTLLLHGEHSDLLTNDIAQDTLAILEYGHYAKIKNRGHIPLLTESDSISAIDDFLNL